ncbi:hypothetical protein GKE82_10760 [Conexibacter sp. W3-3-2]|uniref:choice-of-anchor Q domain-containing protein n=1 Tax=Conexibacter sp. W3-3-2 TaxID=2675227 RepID=UPI0012B6C353|nr:choice-of-anchor Q domain-containing protein [Conexibacter sp. W3-3-2]MTD44757.1 hypothetical protein [Conexibacter sp. W3-3-2]
MSNRSVRRAHRRRVLSAAKREQRLRRAGLIAGGVAGASAVAASGAHAATFVVTTTADRKPAIETRQAPGDELTLRSAVEQANATDGPDTITFASGLTGTIRLVGGQLDVAPGGLTITGPGSQLLSISGDSDGSGTTGQGDTRILEVSPDATLALSGLTLTRGWVNDPSKYGGGDGGGAILVRAGATLDLRDAALTANSTTGTGGAIAAGGTTTVARTTFQGNGATGPGGAIAQFVPGSDFGPDAVVGALTIEDSAFSGNASAFSGGAVARSKYGRNQTQAPLTIRGSRFAANTAGVSGGAVGVNRVDDTTPLTVTTSTFADNTAGDDDTDGTGGGLLVGLVREGATATVDRSTFSGNVAGSGGGLTVLAEAAADANVTRSTFTGNRAGQGAAIGIQDPQLRARRGTRAAAPTDTGVTLDALTIAGNTATDADGGAVRLDARPAEDPQTQQEILVAPTQVLRSSIVAGNTTNGAPGDLGIAPGTQDTPGTGFVLQHSLVQVPGTARVRTDAARPSLIGVDPQLGALADNGGPTATQLPSATSPALDAGSAAPGVTADQRGAARTVDLADVANATGGDGTDIGAVERDAPPAPAPQPQPAAPAAAVPAAVPPAPTTPAGSTAIALPQPISRPAVVRAPRQPITIRGTAGRGTTKVRVSVARKVGSKCRFLRPDQRFSALRDCRRTLYVTAEGTRTWRLALPVLAKGRYTIWSRAIVAGRLVEAKKTTQNFRRFEIE